MLTDTGFSWIWDTDEFLKLGRKQKKKTEKRKKKKKNNGEEVEVESF